MKLAFLDPQTQRWVIEQGDLVYWRETVEDFPSQWTKAKVELVTGRHMYLVARAWERPKQILLGAVTWHVVPQRAVQHEGSRRYYDWSNPTMVAQPGRVRKAS